jgi:hypothetical protein
VITHIRITSYAQYRNSVLCPKLEYLKKSAEQKLYKPFEYTLVQNIQYIPLAKNQIIFPWMYFWHKYFPGFSEGTVYYSIHHGLIIYIDTKVKCRYLNKIYL